MPGARPAFAAAGFKAASRRRPPDAVTVAKGGSAFVMSVDASAEAEARLGSEPPLFSVNCRSRSIGQLGRKTYMTRRIRYLHIPRLHNPLGRHAAAATQQFDAPARLSDQLPKPGVIDVSRGQCRDAPAGHGRARPLAFALRLLAIAPAPQQKSGDAGALGGKLQAATRHERQSPDLADDRDKTGGAQPFLDRPQEVLIARRRDDDEAGGIEAVRQKSRPVQIRPLQAPQHRPPAEAGEEAGDKAASGGAVLLVAIDAKDLVHRAQGETAARQRAVGRGDAERQDAMACRLLDMPDSLAERCEGARPRHLLRKIMPHHLRKAHLLTCNYRLFAGVRVSCLQAERAGLLGRFCKTSAAEPLLNIEPRDISSRLIVLYMFSFLRLSSRPA